MLSGRLHSVNCDRRRSYALSVNTAEQSRFELRLGDDGFYGRPDLSAFPSNRAELSAKGANTKFAFGTEYWIAYSFLVEDGPVNTSTRGPYLGQFHATDDANDVPSSPPLAVLLNGETFQIVTTTTAEDPHTVNPPDQVRYSTPFVRGVPWDIVYRVTFGWQTGSASLEAWVNDVKVVEDLATEIGYNDAVGLYFIQGIYRFADAPETLIARYSKPEWGVADLSSRIGNPLPVYPTP
mgnify:CR=1 FL=1|jgi:hypothetical protein|tara:strand:- start:15309 stop:16019 length:711 start_codon:yes stop_codon:yes gene_type:complete